jgi:hypothetical protein
MYLGRSLLCRRNLDWYSVKRSPAWCRHVSSTYPSAAAVVCSGLTCCFVYMECYLMSSCSESVEVLEG